MQKKLLSGIILMMDTDFCIIGSGIAGLSLALKLSKIGTVILLTKKGITSGSTGLAQGGIAGVRNFEQDSAENHFQDTLKAGAFHNNSQAVRLLVEKGKQALENLEEWGVKFDFSLHREGGHTYARIFHVADETGRVVQEILASEVRKNTNIQVMEDCFVVDLLKTENTIWGCSFFQKNSLQMCMAQKTILATGGAGQIYAKTTNPRIITGDGIAMAMRAGAKLQDMEFVQFHPTALDRERDPMFLLSEALRGAGAKIVDRYKKQFVDELAPRDEVSRAIFLKKQHGKNVFLDFRHEKEEVLVQKFPMIFENLISFGLNLAEDMIPITPAEHFFCGGIQTDLYGQTSLKNLFAVGEVACTGAHGANRLASNSLLEGVVFAQQIFQYISQYPIINDFPPLSSFQISEFRENNWEDEEMLKKIQHIMQMYCGVVRTKQGMERGIKELCSFQPQGTEIQNVLFVAKEVLWAAKAREKSLGCHILHDQI